MVERAGEWYSASMSPTPENRDDPREEGISLQELSEAFARVMGGQPDLPLTSQRGDAQESRAETTAQTAAVEPAEAPAVVEPPEPAGTPPTPASESDTDDDPCQLSPRSILEAMLFVGNRQSEPLVIQQASDLMRGVTPEEIPALVEELNCRYQEDGCPYEIVAERGGYRMALRDSFFTVRARLYGRVREARLSQAAIDVLAIVAYRQPLSGDEVGRLRGKPSGHVLAQLVRRQLLRIERSEEKPRRTTYHTTGRFLALFGLESLDDLPQSDELDRR